MTNNYDDLEELTKDLVQNTSPKELKKVNSQNKPKDETNLNNSKLIIEEISKKEKSSKKIKELFLKNENEEKKNSKINEFKNLEESDELEAQFIEKLDHKSFQRENNQNSIADNFNQEIEIKTMSKPTQIQKPNSDSSPFNFLFNPKNEEERPKSGMKENKDLEFKQNIKKPDRPNTSQTDQELLFFQKMKKEEKKSDKSNLENINISENLSDIGKGIPIVDLGHSRLSKRRLKDNRSSISGQSERPISANQEARSEMKAEIKRTGFGTGIDFFKQKEQQEQIGSISPIGGLKKDAFNPARTPENVNLGEKNPVLGDPEKSIKLEPFSFYQKPMKSNVEVMKQHDLNPSIMNINNLLFDHTQNEGKEFLIPEKLPGKKVSVFKNRPATPDIKILDMIDGSKLNESVEDPRKEQGKELIHSKGKLEEESFGYLQQKLVSLKYLKQESESTLELKKAKLNEIEIEKESYGEKINNLYLQNEEIIKQNKNYYAALKNEMKKKLEQEKKEFEKKNKERLENLEIELMKYNEIKQKQNTEETEYYKKEYETNKKLNDMKEIEINEAKLWADSEKNEIKKIKMKEQNDKNAFEKNEKLFSEFHQKIMELEEEKVSKELNLEKLKQEVTKLQDELNLKIEKDYMIYTNAKNENKNKLKSLKNEEEILRGELYESQFKIDKDKEEIRLRKKNIDEIERSLNFDLERQMKFIEEKKRNLVKLEEDAIEKKVKESKEIDQQISYIQQEEFDLSQREIKIEQRKKDIINKEEDLKIKIAEFNLEKKHIEVNRNKVQQTALKVMEESEIVKNSKQQYEEMKEKLNLKAKELESQKIALNASKSALERERLDLDTKAKQIQTTKLTNQAPSFSTSANAYEKQFENYMKEKLISKSSFKETLINTSFNANEYLQKVDQELGINFNSNQNKVMDYIAKEKELLFENRKSYDIKKFEMSKQNFSEDNDNGPTSSMRKGYPNSNRKNIYSINSPSVQSRLKDNAYPNDSEG